MKKLSLLLAACLLLSITMNPVIYADQDVSESVIEKMIEAAAANSDSGVPESVIEKMIEAAAGNATSAKENGNKYLHDGNSYTFLDFTGNIQTSNGTTVTVFGNVNGSLSASGEKTTVTVDGGVHSYGQQAVNVTDFASVFIDQDVIGSEGSTYTYIGSSGEEHSHYSPNTTISASDGGTVTVGGNVTTSEKDIAINASYGASVEVSGVVNGGNISVYGRNTEVTVGGGTISTAQVSGEGAILSGVENIEQTGAGPALSVNDGGTAEIDGNINGGAGQIVTFGIVDGEPVTFFYQGTAISASNNASVTVGGDVTVGEGYIEIIPTEYGYSTYNRTNTAIDIKNNTTITVGGNITVGENDTAIRAYYGSVVNVSGEINGGSIILSDTASIPNPDGTMSMVTVSGEGSHVTAGGGTISRANVTGDGSSLSGITNIEATGFDALYAWGDVEVSIDNDVSIGGTKYTMTGPDGNEITVYQAGSAIVAGDGASVTVGGDVFSKQSYTPAIYSYDEAFVYVGGDVEGSIQAQTQHRYSYDENGKASEEVNNKKGGTVIVDGHVNAKENGIIAQDGAIVGVGDGVTSGGVAISANNGSKVTVNGDVTAKQNGILADNFSFVDVQGNVSTDNFGIRVWLNSGEGKPGSIIVNGTVDAKNRAIDLPISGNANVEDILSVIPHIIVQTLKSDGDLVVVTAPGATAAEKQALQNALIDNIFYIVNTDGVDTTKIAVYGTEVVDGYVVATEESIITLESKDSGYVVCNVEAGRYATVTENPDGSVSVTVERGGDLNISADVKEKNSGRKYDGHGNYINWDGFSSPWSDYGSRYFDHRNEPAINYNDSWGWQGAEVHHTDYSPGSIWQPNYQNKGWDTAYAISPDHNNMVLVINLVGRQDLCVLRSDLESFHNIGFETVNIVTEESSMYMTMSNLLELYAGANQCMFVNNGYSVELWVMNTLVFTITMVNDEEKVA